MENNLSETIRGYIAGLYEGEGSCQGKNGWSIRIGMTDIEPLQICFNTLGGSLNGPYKYRNKKDLWTWGIWGYENLDNFYKVFGDMLSPRRQAQLLKALSKTPHVYPVSLDCGRDSVAGRQAHIIKKEPPCKGCRGAWNRYQYNRNHKGYIAP